jgi:hypothetical protein
MRRSAFVETVRGLSWIAIAMAATTSAFAEPPPSEQVSETTFHQGQFGLSARLAVGYRAVKPNDQTTYCGTLDSTAQYGYANVCTERAPLALDLEAAYGVAKSIEVLVDVSIGIEKDFDSKPTTAGAADQAVTQGNGPRPIRLEPGARFFFAEAAHLKMFAQPMMVLDFTGYSGRSFDMGLRAIQGVWLDLHRTYGIYFFVGETLELYRWLGSTAYPSRWLDAGFEAGIGFQGRYP